MERVIKFRGKRVDNGEWVYGDLIQSFCDDKTYIDPNNCFDIKHILVNPPIEIDKETVGQLTGLLDKNGKEIYEGDIVNLFYENDDDVYVIEWHNYTSRFEINSKTLSVDFDNYYSYELEVIGNIHDNPEPLEVE